jgi:RNA recognition motif-containing protein
MGKKLYVGNLSYDTDSSSLEQLFSAHGTVQSAEVIAALFAAESVGGVGEIDYDGLRGWATSSQGCKGFRQLHRPVLDTDICTLRVTADFVAAGLWEEA